MNYAKYFKTNQKVLLRIMSNFDSAADYSGAITAHIVSSNSTLFEVSLPFVISGDEGAAFSVGQKFQIISEYFGLELKLTCYLEGPTDKRVIRFSPCGDLEFSCRRAYPRCDLSAKIYCIRSAETLHQGRKQWETALKKLSSGTGLPNGKIERLTINLSAGGIAVPLLPATVTVGGLWLIYLDIDNSKIRTWTLGEVVWKKVMENGAHHSGLQFVAISVEDQQQIHSHVINELKKQGCEVDWSLVKKTSLHQLHF